MQQQQAVNAKQLDFDMAFVISRSSPGFPPSTSLYLFRGSGCTYSPKMWFNILSISPVGDSKAWIQYTGNGNYKLALEVWSEIGNETAKATQDIPASYIRVLGDIVKQRSHYNTESWEFWIIYVAPIVLQDRFPDDKYYEHICSLGKIMKTTLKFELTMQDIDELEEEIVQWVERYEEYVFQLFSAATALTLNFL